MQVTLDKRYPIKAPLAACWRVLSDVTELATCMPGAAITEQVDETHYKGAVKVKVGPATAAFAGEIELLAVDAAAYSISLMGKGADKSGSSASMQLTATLEVAADGSTNLLGKAEVIVNGKFAQFGGRMMTSVSDMILAQFAGNFEIKTIALAPESSVEEVSLAQGVAVRAAAVSPAPQAVTELNGLSIAWMLIKSFFGRLVGKKS